ncbi:MAG: hypothetical protein HRF43_01315 [Phycisphaerae bacterium]
MPSVLRSSRRLPSVGVGFSLVLLSAVQAVRADFTLIHNIDLGPYLADAGNNPFSVTFDGAAYAFIGGYNNSNAVRQIGILKINISNPADNTVLTAAHQTVDNNRFYHGIVYHNGILYAMLDRPQGTIATTNLRAIDVATGGLLESFDGDDTLNPGNGVVKQPAGISGTQHPTGGLAYDPGWNGSDKGLAFFVLGSGRRLMVDAVTGATLYNTATGMIVFGAGFPDGTTWRDVVFDANGDVYQRRSNQVQRAIRSGGNTISSVEALTDALTETGAPLADPGDGKPIALWRAGVAVGQNLALLKAGGGAGPDDLIIFNDRINPPSSGSFAERIKIMRKDGSLPPNPPKFLRPDATPINADDTPDSLTTIYDFHYDELNDLLLILDFSNRRLYVFQGPQTPAACCLPDGACEVLTKLECSSRSGVFNDGLACEQVSCPKPCPDPFADEDGDGDVDQKDFGALQACFTGAAGPRSEACKCFDRDGDLLIDSDDLFGPHNTFTACQSGPDIPADKTCDD